MEPPIDLKDVTTNLVRRPIDGYVLTASGRRIPEPPWIFPDDAESEAAYDEWLIEQGKKEAMELADQWMVRRLEEIEVLLLTDELRHLLSDYLFGIPNPEFEAHGALEDAQ